MVRKIALSVFIFSIVVLFFMIILIFFESQRNEITGRAIENSEDTKEIKIACTDSDNGKEYFIKGTADYCDSKGCSSKEDSCSGKKLIEQYCNGNEAAYEEYQCDSECYDGICIEIATKYRYTSTPGSVRGGGGSSSPATEESQVLTYDLGVLASENTLELVKGNTVGFIIGSEDYTLTLSSNTETQAVMNTNKGQIFTFIVSEEQEIDLNNDGASETYVKIKSINTIEGKIKLILRPV